MATRKPTKQLKSAPKARATAKVSAKQAAVKMPAAQPAAAKAAKKPTAKSVARQPAKAAAKRQTKVVVKVASKAPTKSTPSTKSAARQPAKAVAKATKQPTKSARQPMKSAARQPTKSAARQPTKAVAKAATKAPTKTTQPTKSAARQPTKAAAKAATKQPTKTTQPTKSAARQPTKAVAKAATKQPTKSAARQPTKSAAKQPTKSAARQPTKSAARQPTKRSAPLINLLGDSSSARRAVHAIAPGAGAHALGRELGDVVAIEVEAEAALESGDLQRAIAVYTRLIESSPTPIASHLIARGRAYYRAADHPSAIGDFERGLAIEPHYPDLYFDKGKAELQAGRVGDAEASFTQDLELDPSPISFYNRHLARKALGDRDGALTDLDCAIEGMPDELPLRVARSILRASSNDIEGAFADAEAAVALDPHDVTLHDRCGRLALALGRNERAADAYAAARRIAVEAGELPDAEHLAGEALAIGQLGRHADALTLLDRALAIAPDDPTLHCNRGWMFHLAGRDTEALIDLDRAITLDPQYAKALQNRATIYTARGDRNRALADYRTLDSLGHDVRDAIARLVSP